MANSKIKGIGFTTSKPIRQHGKGVNGNKIEGMSYINSPAIGPGCGGKCRKTKKESPKNYGMKF